MSLKMASLSLPPAATPSSDGCAHDPVHSQICVPPLVLLRAWEEPDAMTFLVGRVTSEFGHCRKVSPVG